MTEAKKVIAQRVHLGSGAPPSPLADAIINDLRTAGYIIVRHDAIKLAQAHARAEVMETRRAA